MCTCMQGRTQPPKTLERDGCFYPDGPPQHRGKSSPPVQGLINSIALERCDYLPGTAAKTRPEEINGFDCGDKQTRTSSFLLYMRISFSPQSFFCTCNFYHQTL